MLRRVPLVRTDVSKECSASIIIRSIRRSVLRKLDTANVVLSSSILVTLMMEALLSFETSILTRATRRNIPEGGIFHSHRRENHKSYRFVKSHQIVNEAIINLCISVSQRNLYSTMRNCVNTIGAREWSYSVFLQQYNH
jgi:hypothetical protein